MLTAGVAVAVLLGAAVGAYEITRPGSITASGAAPAASELPQVLFFPRNGATGVHLDSPLSLIAPLDRVTSVTVRSESDGAQLGGAIASNGHTWGLSSGHLKPGTKYLVAADLRTPSGQKLHTESFFTTLVPRALLDPTITPEGGTYGVGEPVVVSFNVPVEDKASVQSHLFVKMSNPVPGAWHWINSQEVHYRPAAYWPTGEHVTVQANLDEVDAGHNVWGSANRSTSFTIGDSHVTTVDLDSHQMTITDNGAVVRSFAISGGRDQYPTMNGVHIVLDKQYDVHMVSSTVGIPVNSPDGYDEHVFDDVEITTGGEYVHNAPWSVSAQGNANVSHGCVNVGPDNASWFFGFSQTGDIVRVVNSPRPPTDDPGTVDWNMSWDQWLAGSAI